jgi:hypothetical protein
MGTVCVLALGVAASPAMAANGFIGGSYASGDNHTGDIWGANGALEGMFSDSWGIEGDASYHSGSGTDLTTVGGNVFWDDPEFKLDANVTYHDASASFGGFGGSADIVSYGGGAEFFAGDSLTLAARGGGFSGSHLSGGYVGGDVQWYLMPDLSLNGQVDYVDIASGITSETLKAEWLVSESTPISVYGGYQHVDVTGGDANVWFIGLNLYVNGNGADTLVDRQRTGALGYLGQSPLAVGTY